MPFNVLFPSGKVMNFAIREVAVMYANAYKGFLMEPLDILTETRIMVPVE